MAETLEIDGISAVPPDLRRATPARSPLQVATSRARFKGLAASVAQALEERRLFILIPFAMIAGLITSIELPAEPEPWLLAAGAAAIAVALLLSLRSIAAIRLLTLVAAVWAGPCLLPIHGALEGTPMLARPAYGTYTGRVDAVLNQTPGAQRVVL